MTSWRVFSCVADEVTDSNFSDKMQRDTKHTRTEYLSLQNFILIDDVN